MWSYNLIFISWQVLVRRSNGILHPFSITLENDLLFWSDWTNDSIFATHKLDGGNIFTVYHNLLLNPNGIEAVTPDRQILSECHSFCLCILWCYYEHHVIGWFQKCCEVEKRFLIFYERYNFLLSSLYQQTTHAVVVVAAISACWVLWEQRGSHACALMEFLLTKMEENATVSL